MIKVLKETSKQQSCIGQINNQNITVHIYIIVYISGYEILVNMIGGFRVGRWIPTAAVCVEFTYSILPVPEEFPAQRHAL